MLWLVDGVSLRVRRLRHDSAMYTWEYLAHRLKTVYPNRLTAWLFQSLRDTRVGARGIWLNLMDIMTVYATKD
jgi:hypothetical protein